MNKTSVDTNYSPHVALVAVQLFFGAFPVVGKYVLQTIPSFAMVGFRVGGAALAFVILQLISKDGLRLDKKSHYGWFALYSLLGVVLNQLLFISGLALTTATNTSLLAVLIPIFALLVGVVLRLDTLSGRKIFGVVLAAAGVVYLIDPAKASFSSATTRGDFFIIVNCFFYASYIAVSKRLIQHYGALKSMAWLFLFGSIITVPLGAYSMRAVDLANVPSLTWLAIVGIVIFPTILAYYLNAWALARVSPSVVAIYIYLQPLIGFVSAVIFLNEHFSLRLIIAALLIFTGLFLVTRKPKENPIDLTYP
ncbi:MAG TPA: DMT family transporter [Pyrinomonadaceae bacterium]|nr:DMT family transporter [Pyrinomonadaceae bacterium]